MKNTHKILWARFRRGLYLLLWGMWRGEQSYTARSPWHVQISAATDLTETTYRETKSFYDGKP